MQNIAKRNKWFTSVMVALTVGTISVVNAADESSMYSYKVKDKYMKNICFLPVNLDGDWESALDSAVDAYNYQFSSTTKINFTFVRASYQKNYCKYIVKVESGYDRKYKKVGMPYAAVTFPIGGHDWYKKPCDSIFINLSNVANYIYTSEKQYLLMHEMGHVIGLDHKASYHGKPIPGTSDDPLPWESIMRAGGGDDVYSQPNYYEPIFSDYDVRSIEWLYGKWK